MAVAQAQTITILTHDSFALDKALIKQFERSGVKLRFIKGGDAGAMLNKAILSKSAPVADVIYGIDNILLTKALAADILEPYKPQNLAGLYPDLLLDQSGRATPVNFGYVTLNYDLAAFKNKPLPKTLQDLAKPAFAKQLVVQNPATSSPGVAFLVASVQAFGEDYLQFWEDLRKNGVRVANGWSEAYYTQFSRAGGDRPLVVSYNTSPAAEFYYGAAKTSMTAPPTANLLLQNSFKQVEFVGVLKGTRQPKAAQKFIDWLISKEVQENIPTQMWVYPALRQADLPEVYRWAKQPTAGDGAISYKNADNLQRWIRDWTKVVLQGQSAKSIKP
jgi:thiamine transport system substrate-binding protein